MLCLIIEVAGMKMGWNLSRIALLPFFAIYGPLRSYGVGSRRHCCGEVGFTLAADAIAFHAASAKD